MIKTLIQHGNSYALVIDRTIMELLKITPSTPLELKVDGGALHVHPAVPPPVSVNKALIRERRRVHTRIIQQLLEGTAMGSGCRPYADLSPAEREERTFLQNDMRQTIREHVYSDPAPLLMFERGIVFEQVLDAVFGFGPVGPALRDPTLNDIAIEADGSITGDGRTLPLEFDDDAHIREVVSLMLPGKRKAVGKYVQFTTPGGGSIRVAKKWVPESPEKKKRTPKRR